MTFFEFKIHFSDKKTLGLFFANFKNLEGKASFGWQMPIDHSFKHALKKLMDEKTISEWHLAKGSARIMLTFDHDKFKDDTTGRPKKCFYAVRNQIELAGLGMMQPVEARNALSKLSKPNRLFFGQDGRLVSLQPPKKNQGSL